MKKTYLLRGPFVGVLFIFSLFSKERHKLGKRFVKCDLHGDLWENDQIKRC